MPASSFAGCLAATVLLAAATAHAEDPNAPQPPPPPPAQPAPAQPPPGEPAVPPPGYGQQPPPPPGYGQPPQAGGVVVVEQGSYGYGLQQQPYGYADPREVQYLQSRKSVFLAVLFDALLPGLGNIYADAILYSVITWVGLIAGMTMIINGVNDGIVDDGTASSMPDDDLLIFGSFLILGSYTFGCISAGFNAASYNADLRVQLGLHAAVTPTPDRAGATIQLGATF
jgi:hypothetical protein